jgi:phospholipid/cholesterol/gamma-HCH transport system permease protein
MLDGLGQQAGFYAQVAGTVPRTLHRYWREVLRLIAEISLGRGAIAVAGGTVGVIAVAALFNGTAVGLRGYAALNQVGPGAFTGILSAYLNTREIAPLATGIALSLTVGAGFTAQLAAARVSTEIDAMDAMGLPTLAFLVTTRTLAALAAMAPLYVVGLLVSYLVTRTIATGWYGQTGAAYDHQFHLFLPPGDLFASFGKAMVFGVLVVLIHGYYGYHASGGPGGAGVAVGRAVRTSIVAIAVAGFLLSLAMWGTSSAVRIAG